MAAAKHLFETIEQIQKHFPFDGNFAFWELESDLSLVEEKYFIEDLIGAETFASVLEEIGAEEFSAPEWAELAERLRAPAAKLTALYHLPEANVKYTGSGLLVSRNEKAAPASDFRKKDLELSLKSKSQDLLDHLLRFLERNTAIFTDWAASANRLERSVILPDAATFSKSFSISDNHWVYRKLQSLILEVEDQHLVELLGEEYLAELRTELRDGSPSEDTAKVLRFIQPFVANTTMAIAFPRLRINISPRGLIFFNNERSSYDDSYLAAPDTAVQQVIDKAHSIAAGFASDITDLLNTNASDTRYTTYRNSDKYQDPDIDVNDFGNDPDDEERIGFYTG